MTHEARYTHYVDEPVRFAVLVVGALVGAGGLIAWVPSPVAGFGMTVAVATAFAELGLRSARLADARGWRRAAPRVVIDLVGLGSALTCGVAIVLDRELVGVGLLWCVGVVALCGVIVRMTPSLHATTQPPIHP